MVSSGSWLVKNPYRKLHWGARTQAILVVEKNKMQSKVKWLVAKICSSGSQAWRMIIHSGVQERLGRVAKFSVFYLAGFSKEFVILQ